MGGGGSRPKDFTFHSNLSLVLSGVLNIGTAIQCYEIRAAAIAKIREILRGDWGRGGGDVTTYGW